MAKLSAHGYEVARLAVVSIPSDPDLAKREMVYSYRSDGHILRKHVLTWADTGKVLSGERHDYGWKLWKRFSDRKITPDRIRVAACKHADRTEAKGGDVRRIAGVPA